MHADTEFWQKLNPFDQVGMTAAVPASARTSMTPGIGRSALPATSQDWDDRLWHPNNPLFWAGAFIAVTVGLIATSTTIRVGPFKASASAGKA